MRALQTETVPRLRSMLLQVLEQRQRSSGATKIQRPDAALPPEDRLSGPTTQLASEQVDMAALIRHELSPAVGWIRLAADREIPNFGTSDTNEAVRKLQRRIDGLVAMIKAGEELNFRPVTIPNVLLDNWPDTRTTPNIEPPLGYQNIDIITDEGLFALLLSNVYQNAIDASVDLVGEPRVHITWGYTERNYWVRITNPFGGDRFTLRDVVAVGNSSKASHQGQGLSLIQSVAARLRIAITLEGQSGIASFSMSGTRQNG